MGGDHKRSIPLGDIQTIDTTKDGSVKLEYTENGRKVTHYFTDGNGRKPVDGMCKLVHIMTYLELRKPLFLDGATITNEHKISIFDKVTETIRKEGRPLR